MDSLSIAGGLIIMLAGLVSLLISLKRIQNIEFTLLSLGFFFLLYGLRWFIENPVIEDGAMSFIHQNMPYFHSLLTYLIPIPFAAFLFAVLGRGLYSTLFWFFISTIAYAVFAMIHDFLSLDGALSPSINTGVLAIWCMVGGINVILIRDLQKKELKVLKITLYFFLLCLAYDNLVALNVLPWKFRLEHIDIMVLFIGLVYFAILRYRTPHENPQSKPNKAS